MRWGRCRKIHTNIWPLKHNWEGGKCSWHTCASSLRLHNVVYYRHDARLCLCHCIVLIFYSHMPSVDISVTVCLFVSFVILSFSTVTDFSSVNSCTVVLQRPGHEMAHFCELCSTRSPKSDDHPDVNISIDMRRGTIHTINMRRS